MEPRGAQGKLGSGRVSYDQLGPPRVKGITQNDAMYSNKKGETIAKFQKRLWGQLWSLEALRVS
jgi:hypothetical protein